MLQMHIYISTSPTAMLQHLLYQRLHCTKRHQTLLLKLRTPEKLRSEQSQQGTDAVALWELDSSAKRSSCRAQEHLLQRPFREGLHCKDIV